jgi:hypothetical protein
VHSLTLDSGLFPDAALLSRLRAEGVSIGLTTSGRIRQKRSAGPCR